MDTNELAAKMLILYDSQLPADSRATLGQKMDAMVKVVELLRLRTMDDFEIVRSPSGGFTAASAG